MKGWEPQLPTGFPIERIQRDAVRVAAERRRRRTRRNQRAMSGLCALLVVGTAAVVVARDEPPDQLRAGPGPAGSALPVVGGEGRGLGGASAPGPAAANGRIAFIRSRGPGDPAPAIYVMNDDGSEQTKLAETTQGSDLTWSPDGTRLAFRDIGGIYIIGADGTGERRLANSSNADGWPAWSPDGTRLAFRNADAGGIFVANVDSGERRRLTEGQTDAMPAWSPDGRKIAYARDADIYVMNADGTGQKKLVRLDGFEDAPTWSSDGRRIAFRSNNSILAVDVDGGAARQLASPGGTGLVNPDGQGANKLATSRGTPATPRWSPDGTRIAYAIYQTGEACSIWIMSADGGSQTRLTDNLTCDRDPAWQPRLP